MARDAGEVQIRVTADTSDADGKLAGIGKDADGAFSKIGKAASTATKAVMAITAAAGAAGVAITEIGKEWETSFAKVETIMDTTQLSTEAMKQQILELSSASGVAATDLSESVYNAISATGDTAGAVALVGTASKLATAGFATTADSLDVLNTAINAYGLETSEAQRISDSLIQTQNLGVTTVAELSAGMGKAIASASAYGIDLSNVEATYIAMTKSGISTAESTTYMSSMFKELGDSGKDVAKVLQKETGKSFAQLMSEGWSLADCLKVIYDSTGQNSTALMNMWGSAEAGKAANAIINQGLETFNDNLGLIANSSGMTETAYETMCNTVEHQTQTLLNTVKNIGISMYEGFSPDITSLLKEVNGWANELADAYSSGGVEALGETATKMLPKVTKMVTDLATKSVQGLAKMAPVIGKTLAGMIPQLINSAGDILPSLIDGLSSLLYSAVESITANFPAIFGSLLKATPKVIMSVINGAGGVFDALFDGIDAAMHEGMVKLTSTGKWVDVDQVATMHLDIQTDFTGEQDVQSVADKIAGLQTTIENAVKGIDGVNASDIAKKIINGDTSGALEAILVKSGVDEASAKKAAESISKANDKINTVIAGLGLKPEQEAHLRTLISSGATRKEIEEYLESCGVDTKVADDAAKTITKARDKLNNAIKGLPKGIQNRIRTLTFAGDRAQLVALLQELELSDEDIAAVLESYDSIRGSLEEGIKGIFQNIKTTLTDGEADTAGEMNGLEAQVRGWASQAYEQIEAWYRDELAKLNAKGLSPEAQAEAQKALEAERDKYIKSIGEMESATLDLVKSTAGASGDELEKKMAELDALEARIVALGGSIDELTGKINSATGSGAVKAVEAGLATDEQTVSTAFSLRISEFTLDKKEAEAKKAEAIDELNKLLSSGDIDEATYKSLKQQIEDYYAEYFDGAQETYDANMAKLLLGLAQAGGQSQEELVNALKSQDMAGAATEVLSNLTAGVSFDQMSDDLKQRFAEAFNISPDELGYDTFISSIESVQPEFAEAIKSLMSPDGQVYDVDSMNILTAELARAFVASGAAAFEQAETGPMGAAIQALINEHVFDDIVVDVNGDGIDFSDVIAYYQDSLTKDLSENPLTGEYTTELTAGETTVDDGDPKKVVQTVIDRYGHMGIDVTVPTRVKPEVTNVDADGTNGVEQAFQESLGRDTVTVTAPTRIEAEVRADNRGTTVEEWLAREKPEVTDPEPVTVTQPVETEYTYEATETPEGVDAGLADGGELDPVTVTQPVNVEPDLDTSSADTAGATYDAAVAASMTANAGTVNAAASGVASGTAPSWVSGVAGAISGGVSTAAGFASGILTGGASASGNAASVASGSATSFGSASGTAVQYGVDLAAGYARGILSGKNSAVNAAISLARAALAAVKSTQASASPSKEAAKLGRHFGQGYEVGIEESMADAVNTAKRMTGEVLSASVIGSNGLGVLRVEAGSEPLQVAMEGADAPVYLDGKQIASIQGGNNRSELNWLQKRNNRGYGR